MQDQSFIIGFTGTALGMTPAQQAAVKKILQALFGLGGRQVHLGDCIGADAEAWLIATQIGYQTIGHLPASNAKRAFLSYDEVRAPLPYLDRNHAIVSESNFLLGAPAAGAEALRSGTWATIRYGRKLARTGLVITPDGELRGLST